MTIDASKSGLVLELAEEFLGRYRRGERPSLKEYIDRRPDLAAEIRQVFPAVAMMENIALADESLGPAAGGRRPSESPHQIGDYRLIREVGRGGMGVVYEAEQLSLRRHVALKVLPGAALLEPRQVERFEREARAAAKLHHTNIVPVYGVGHENGLRYYVMQFIQGQPLDQVLAELRRGDGPGASSSGLSGSGRAYWQAVARVGAEAARALDYAHNQGVLHRDVKPSNLLLDAQGTVWVTDFGLAKAADGGDLTGTGEVVGTLRYIPPERFRGTSDAQGDVYSLGLTLYEMLTLRPAFDTEDRVSLVEQILHTDPPPPRKLNPEVPRDLETVVLKAMAREPGHRYPTAAEFAADLQRVADDQPIRARRVGVAERAWRWARHRPAAAGLLVVSAVAALALVGVAVGLLYNFELERAHQETRDALRAESEARQAAEMYQYFHHVGRAHAEWRDGKTGRVEPLLDAAPEGLRAWEWHYLKRLCRPDALTRTHGGGVFAVAFHPAGTHFASTGHHKVIRLWDLRTGEQVRTFLGHSDIIRGLSFSPDGKRLASASADQTVRVWDVATGEEVLTLRGHTANVRGVAFSPDGTRLATSGTDATVRLWDAAGGAELGVLRGDEDLYQVAFSPDGTRVVAAGADQTVTVWDAATGREVRRLRGHTRRVIAVAFSPDGTRLASGGWDNAVKVWDLDTGKEVLTLRGHAGYVRGVAFSPDGKLLASAGVDQAIKVWDAGSGREEFTLRGHRSEVAAVAFSPDGAWLASTSADGTVRLWAAAPRQEALALPAHAADARAVAFNPDGGLLASGGEDGAVTVLDVRTGQEVHRLARGPAGPAYGVAFRPDGRRLAVGGLGGTLLLWEPGAADPLALRGHSGTVFAVAFSPDGSRLASAGADRTVRLWDATSGRPAAVIEGHAAGVRGLSFSPDGGRLASAGEDGAVKVWEVDGGREALSFPAHDVSVWAVAFSPDGARLATGGWDNQARLWDAATGRMFLPPLHHSSDVWGVAFSPDGRRLASASADQTVKLWDTATGQEAVSLRGHGGHIWGVAFSPDGTRLASASEGRAVKVWDATALTPEAGAERDAVALLDFLFARPLREADVIDYLTNSPAVPDRLRRPALALAAGYREETDPKTYHAAAWPVVRHPYSTAAACRFAVAQMKAACERAPDDLSYRLGLGVAQYRLGRFEPDRCAEALTTLGRCDQDRPATLAFRAMAHHRAGHKAEAVLDLARLRDSLKDARTGDAEARAWLREAEAVIGGER